MGANSSLQGFYDYKKEIIGVKSGIFFKVPISFGLMERINQ